MASHESGVNFANLITDLADMYPQDVPEVVVVELVANSLDAKATLISIDYDPSSNVLVVTDNGNGMTWSQFDQYHDFAAGFKTRGTGIGFAGVGAKISFNVADRVITETYSQEFSGGSDWHWQSRKKLVWQDILVTSLNTTGTRVAVHFRQSTNVPYATQDDLIALLRRNYYSLLDTRFLALYERLGVYSSQLRFVINGDVVTPSQVAEDLCEEGIKQIFPTHAGKRIGFGMFGLTTSEYALGEDACGVLMCTHGKVVKSELFSQSPGTLGPKVFGIVEIRDLINFLTTSKTDFKRGKGRNREFERLYDPVRQEFRLWLSELGIQSTEKAEAEDVVRLERELRRMAEHVPELSDFFGFRARTQVLQPAMDGTAEANIHQGVDLTFPDGEGKRGEGEGPLEPGDQPGETLVKAEGNGTEKAKSVSRTGRQGPRVAFDFQPDKIELGWVEGNSVIINSGHPSYKKASVNLTSKLLQNLFAVGSAVQRFAMDPADGSVMSTPDLTISDRILAAWADR